MIQLCVRSFVSVLILLLSQTRILSGSGGVFTITDYMLFTSNELIYFEVHQPNNIAYIFKLKPAKDFGGKFDFFYPNINLIPANPSQACQVIKNGHLIKNNIALVDRGGCSFLSKALQVERVGAKAIVIADNDSSSVEALVDMIHDETGRKVTIPAGFITGQDGHHIKEAIAKSGLSAAYITIPVNVTTRPELYHRQPPWSFW